MRSPGGEGALVAQALLAASSFLYLPPLLLPPPQDITAGLATGERWPPRQRREGEAVQGDTL
jgi:hypothetical protein